MASLNTNAQRHFAFSGVMARLSWLAHAIGDALVRAAERRSPAPEIERLRNLSEAEQHALGIHDDSDLIRYACRNLIAY